MPSSTSARLLLGVVLALTGLAAAPRAHAADCTATVNGAWNAPGTWGACGGVGGFPGAADNATVPATLTVTLFADAAVNNLTLLGTTTTRLAIGAFVLEVNGTVSGQSTMISTTHITTTTGRLKFVGGNRALFGTNWAASTTNWRVEVALNFNTPGTASTAIKVGELIVTSGTFDVAGDLRIDTGSGSNGGGSITVASGGTLIGRGLVGTRITAVTSFGGPITVDGTLEVRGTGLNGSTITINGKLVRSTSTTALATAPGTAAAPTFTYGSTATLEYTFSGSRMLTGAEVNAATGSTTVGTTTGELIPNLLVSAGGGLNIQTSIIVGASHTISGFPVITTTGQNMAYLAGATLTYNAVTAQTALAAPIGTNVEWTAAAGEGPTNVVFSNISGVTMDGTGRSVPGVLTIQVGNLVLGANQLAIGPSGSIVGAGPSNYIRTNGLGRLTKTGLTGTFTFPIGPNINAYNPVTVTNTGAAGDFSARVSEAFTVAPPAPNQTVGREWHVSTTAVAPSATLAFQIKDAERGAGFNPAGPVAVGYLDEFNAYQELPATYAFGPPETVTASGATTFSTFVVGNAGILPVELTAFTGTADGNDAVLSWTTASETNAAAFEVERFADGVWTNAGSVPAHGTTLESHAYRFRVAGVGAGRHRFRLRGVDFDGTPHLSAEVEVAVEMAEALVVERAFPNPFGARATVRFGAREAQRVVVEAYDALGRRVAVLFDGRVEANAMRAVTLDAAGLAAGVYVVRVVGERARRTQAVTLAR